MGKCWGISKWIIMMTNWPKKIKIRDILGGSWEWNRDQTAVLSSWECCTRPALIGLASAAGNHTIGAENKCTLHSTQNKQSSSHSILHHLSIISEVIEVTRNQQLLFHDIYLFAWDVQVQRENHIMIHEWREKWLNGNWPVPMWLCEVGRRMVGVWDQNNMAWNANIYFYCSHCHCSSIVAY